MSTNYIPAKDSLLDTWMQNFQAVIAASPATYGLLAADATAITAAYNSYHAAYTLLTVPATKTAPNVAAKDTAKAAALVTVRGYAQVIGNNQGVSNTAKSAAGLTVRATGRTPIPAPGTAPVLGFIGATPQVQTLKFADVSTPTTKKKPFGAIQMEVWSFIGTTPPVGGPAGCTFVGLFTKTPFALNYQAGDAGKTAYIYGRWVTRRGLTGPWSAVLSAGIV